MELREQLKLARETDQQLAVLATNPAPTSWKQLKQKYYALAAGHSTPYTLDDLPENLPEQPALATIARTVHQVVRHLENQLHPEPQKLTRKDLGLE